MISYSLAKSGKRIMKRLLENGKWEEAALIGLLYQMPIRVGDAVTLRKSDLSGRYVLKTTNKYGDIYRNHVGSPFRITKQLNNLLLSLNKDSDMIFTKSKAYFQNWFQNHYRGFCLYDFRRVYLMRREVYKECCSRKRRNVHKRVSGKDGAVRDILTQE